jgi:hypothetical protein
LVGNEDGGARVGTRESGEELRHSQSIPAS